MITADHIDRFLLNQKSYHHPCGTITLIETHISKIFLTGEFAYKLKKPLDVGFLNFTHLEDRKFFLDRELTLNQRYSSELYLEVVPIFLVDNHHLTFSSAEGGTIIEYVLKMKEFNPHDVFSELLAEGKIDARQLEIVINDVAALHQSARRTPDKGSFDLMERLILENIEVLRHQGKDLVDSSRLASIASKFDQELAQHRSLIEARRATSVCETHGDLHLGNICLYQGKPTLFDGLEFNESYSCTDVWADFAFLFMDLMIKGRADFAYHCVNHYLRETDDFEGLPLLRLFAAYRACVRAKVTLLSFLQHSDSKHAYEVERYLKFADEFLTAQPPLIVIGIGGVSGSGKSTVASALSDLRQLIWIRSDAVRKHLTNTPLTRKALASAYTSESSERVYMALRDRVEICIRSGHSVVVDAVFLSADERRALQLLAQSCGALFLGVWCEVPHHLARSRIQRRTGDISDADSAVLRQQLEATVDDLTWTRLATTSGAMNEAEMVWSFVRNLTSITTMQ